MSDTRAVRSTGRIRTGMDGNIRVGQGMETTAEEMAATKGLAGGEKFRHDCFRADEIFGYSGVYPASYG